MIQIKKGSQILTVSKCAYEDMFKKLGYQVINNSEEAKKASSDKKIIDNKEEKLIEEEKSKNEKIEKEDVVTSESLNVNIIGENIENFADDNKKEKTIMEKALENKSSSKRK